MRIKRIGILLSFPRPESARKNSYVIKQNPLFAARLLKSRDTDSTGHPADCEIRLKRTSLACAVHRKNRRLASVNNEFRLISAAYG